MPALLSAGVRRHRRPGAPASVGAQLDPHAGPLFQLVWAQDTYLPCTLVARTSAPLIVRRGPSALYRSPPRVAAPPQPAPSGGTYGRGSDNFDLARLRPDQPHLLPRLVRRHLQPEQHHQARLSRVSASLANGQKRHGNVMIVPILPACIGRVRL